MIAMASMAVITVILAAIIIKALMEHTDKMLGVHLLVPKRDNVSHNHTSKDACGREIQESTPKAVLPGENWC